MQITVLTCTYNRANTLERCFQSLLNSTYKNFEWLIIDDGSTDGTKGLIEGWREQAEFPIRYYYKPNGGKHTAVNMGYKFAEGEYMFQLDSDDVLTPEAMQKGLDIWNSIPVREREKYWSVCGRCIDSNTHQLIGDRYPEYINTFSHKKQRSILQRIKGEKFSLQRTDIVKCFPFPEIDGLKFIPEAVVWRMIDKQYRQYYTNEIFRVYHTDNIPRLTNLKCDIKKAKSMYFASMYLLNNDYNDHITPFSEYVKTILNVGRYGIYIKLSFEDITKEMVKINSKIIFGILYLPSKILSKAMR